MRRRLREEPAERHPERRQHQVLRIIAEIDPKDRLGLSAPGQTERLNHVVQQITR